MVEISTRCLKKTSILKANKSSALSIVQTDRIAIWKNSPGDPVNSRYICIYFLLAPICRMRKGQQKVTTPVIQPIRLKWHPIVVISRWTYNKFTLQKWRINVYLLAWSKQTAQGLHRNKRLPCFDLFYFCVTNWLKILEGKEKKW